MTEVKTLNLTDIPQAQLKDLLGKNRNDLMDDVVRVTQQYAKGDYNPREHISSKGTYNSVSIDIIAENIEQVETLYIELAKIDGVRMVL